MGLFESFHPSCLFISATEFDFSACSAFLRDLDDRQKWLEWPCRTIFMTFSKVLHRSSFVHIGFRVWFSHCLLWLRDLDGRQKWLEWPCRAIRMIFFRKSFIVPVVHMGFPAWSQSCSTSSHNLHALLVFLLQRIFLFFCNRFFEVFSSFSAINEFDFQHSIVHRYITLFRCFFFFIRYYASYDKLEVVAVKRIQIDIVRP